MTIDQQGKIWILTSPGVVSFDPANEKWSDPEIFAPTKSWTLSAKDGSKTGRGVFFIMEKILIFCYDAAVKQQK